MRFLLTACLIVPATAAAGAPALAGPEAEAPAPALIEVPRLAFTKRTLANGATLYAIRDSGTATVAINTWYNVGQRDDPAARGGFAHLFEHLMFKTTRNLPKGVLDTVNTIGGSSNASTLFDYTQYYVTAPANELEAMLWLEGERLRNLVVDEASFRSERDVVKEELRQRIFAQPYGRILYTLLPAFTFGGHPYARPIGGTIADLDNAKLADVRAFHEAFYRPDNAIFVVSGNFDPARLDAWADRYLGAIPRPERPIPRDTSSDDGTVAARTIDAYAPNVPLPALVFAWRAPHADDRDAAGVELLDAILTRGASSRLQRALVDQARVASAITSYNLPARDGHAFALVVTLAKGRDIAEAEAALAAEIARLRDMPIGLAELNSVKNGMFGDALSRRETARGRAYELGDGAILTGKPHLADERLATIRRMTAADVARVARGRLADGLRVTIRYRDESARPTGYTGDRAPHDVSAMGPVTPPSGAAPVTIASDAEREHRPAPAAKIALTPPLLGETRLRNGLRVVVAKSSTVPLVSMKLLIDGGDAVDPADRAGRGDIAAALALKGAGTRNADAIASDIAALGGTIDTTSDSDATVFTVSAPAANIDAAGHILADVAMRPLFPNDALALVRDQQAAAIAVAAKQPMQTALRLLPPLMFGDGPYGKVPTAATLGTVTRADVAAMRQQRWTPGASTLILTGSLTPQQGFALAGRLFNDWAPGTPPADAPRGGASAGPVILAVDMPGAAQTAVMAALPTARRSDATWPAVRIANAALGGGFQSWLSQEIRVKRGLSYGAGSLLDARRDGALLIAVTQTKNESAVEVADLVLAQISRFGREPLTAAKAEEREAYLTNGLSTQTERVGGLATYLATLVASSTPLNMLKTELSGGETPSPEQIAAAVNAHIRPEQTTLIVVGDSKQWIAPLRTRFPALRHVDIEGKPIS